MSTTEIVSEAMALGRNYTILFSGYNIYSTNYLAIRDILFLKQ